MKIQNMQDILSGYSFFQKLDSDTLKLVSECAKNAQFEPGKFIFREGETANFFYLIRKGLVALQMATPQRGNVTIETLGDEEILGWSWLIPPYRWHFDARVMEKTTGIAIDGKCLRGKFEKDPRLGYVMLKLFVPIMVARLQATRLRLMDLYSAPATTQWLDKT